MTTLNDFQFQPENIRETRISKRQRIGSRFVVGFFELFNNAMFMK